jgi:mannose-6-phosphate isomerase-like protein (cupin superfamily)
LGTARTPIGPPPHYHPDADETFYVLDGTFTMRVGDQTVQAGAGAVIFVPRGVLHSVANLSAVPARLLYVYAPAGIERYWEELVATQATRGPLDAATIRAIAAKHGTLQVPPPVSP